MTPRRESTNPAIDSSLNPTELEPSMSGVERENIYASNSNSDC